MHAMTRRSSHYGPNMPNLPLTPLPPLAPPLARLPSLAVAPAVRRRLVPAVVSSIRMALSGAAAGTVVGVLDQVAGSEGLSQLVWALTGCLDGLMTCCHAEDVETRVVLMSEGEQSGSELAAAEEVPACLTD